MQIILPPSTSRRRDEQWRDAALPALGYCLAVVLLIIVILIMQVAST